MKIELSIKEYLFIANALNAMAITTDEAMSSCLRKENYDKYYEFLAYKNMCERLEKKIREGIAE